PSAVSVGSLQLTVSTDRGLRTADSRLFRFPPRLPYHSRVHDLVYLLDVDNTLLDNDQIERDLRQHLTDAFGTEAQRRYWDIFEQLRSELGYADYLGALQRYRIERPRDPHLLRVSLFLLHYPFARRLYDTSLAVVAGLRQRAQVVILSDGDVVFQPR